VHRFVDFVLRLNVTLPLLLFSVLLRRYAVTRYVAVVVTLLRTFSRCLFGLPLLFVDFRCVVRVRILLRLDYYVRVDVTVAGYVPLYVCRLRYRCLIALLFTTLLRFTFDSVAGRCCCYCSAAFVVRVDCYRLFRCGLRSLLRCYIVRCWRC